MKNKIISKKTLALPYAIFLVLFVVLPLLVVVYYGFTNGDGQPSITNFLNFFKNGKMMGTLIYSFAIAILTTIFCLLLAYPVALIIAKGAYSQKSKFLMIFVLPMWINFTLRVTALKEILTLIEGNLAYHQFTNTIICMVYDFLPFMIMPLYNSLTKLDNGLIEAAADLGASKRHIFFKVILPLSVPGIVSGVTMVFLPSMTNYVVLDMIYNSTYIMGSLIGSYFSAYDWHNGSVISIVLLLIILGITAISNKYTDQEKKQKRTV